MVNKILASVQDVQGDIDKYLNYTARLAKDMNVELELVSHVGIINNKTEPVSILGEGLPPPIKLHHKEMDPKSIEKIHSMFSNISKLHQYVSYDINHSFFILYYKKSFKNFIIYAFEKENRPDIKDTLEEIKATIQSYIGGLGLLIIILSVLNSIGLSVIGIEHAIFWGSLAGLLAIIPYIGTIIGGLLPFMFALSSAEAGWQPIAVMIYYLVIQQIEGNFITPKIVGEKVDINPLFAILSLVFFGSFWGVAGVVLALPLISILKIILSQFENTKPISVLMSSDMISSKGVYKKLAQER